MGLTRDGRRNGLGGMAEHRAGVAETEVGVLVAVDVAQRRVPGRLDDEREGHRPVAHPMHRHAVVETSDAVTRLLQRSRVRVDIATLLGGEEFADPLQRHAAKKTRRHCSPPI